MADPCATIAGAISVVDVSIRCCRELHDGFRAMKGAPQAIKHAQTTLAMVQSVLEHTRLLATEAEKSAADTNCNNVLSHVVAQSLPGIQSDIEHLKKLLPSQSSSFKASTRVKWLFEGRRVTEIVKKLDSRQILLMVELQIAAQYVLYPTRVSCMIMAISIWVMEFILRIHHGLDDYKGWTDSLCLENLISVCVKTSLNSFMRSRI